ncbi:MAG: response regulator transcription factor [Anaerolineae bacterium]
MSPLAKVKVLVIDDEGAIRKLLQRGLTSYGYEVTVADTGQTGLDIASRQPPDILLLDVNLNSRPDGLEVCQELRQWSTTPVIMLTVRDEKQIKLAAFNAGADDYVTKPFDMDELEARIRAVMRRTAYKGAQSTSGEIYSQDLVIDLIKRRVTLGSEEVHLTPKEYDLLKLLATNPGRVLTFDTLLEKVWGETNGVRSDHNVRVYVNTLRKKLKDDPSSTHKPRFIFNEPGIGYRFADL